MESLHNTLNKSNATFRENEHIQREASINKCSQIHNAVFTIEKDSRTQDSNDGFESTEEANTGKPLTYHQKIVAAVGCYLNVLIVLGFVFSIGALFVEIIQQYNATRSEASLIQSMSVGLTFGAGVLSGTCFERLGGRFTSVLGGLLASVALFTSWFSTSLLFLTITVGVFTGIGSSMIYLSASVTLAQAFTDGRHIVLPGMMGAAGLGSILFPVLLEVMLEEYGLHGTLLIVGAIYLNTVPINLFITSKFGVTTIIQNKGKPKVQGKSFKERIIFLKNMKFLIYMAMSAVSFGVMNSFQVVLVDVLISRGYTTEVGIQCLLIFNATNTLARLSSGLIKMATRLHGSVISSFAAILCGTCFILLRSTEDYSIIVTFITLYGLGIGVLVALFALNVLEFVGLEFLPLGLGLCGMLNGLANPIGAVTMGYIYDRSKSYESSFLMYGIAGIAASTVILFTMGFTKLRHCRSRRVHILNPIN